MSTIHLEDFTLLQGQIEYIDETNEPSYSNYCSGPVSITGMTKVGTRVDLQLSFGADPYTVCAEGELFQIDINLSNMRDALGNAPAYPSAFVGLQLDQTALHLTSLAPDSGNITDLNMGPTLGFDGSINGSKGTIVADTGAIRFTVYRGSVAICSDDLALSPIDEFNATTVAAGANAIWQNCDVQQGDTMTLWVDMSKMYNPANGMPGSGIFEYHYEQVDPRPY
jgi:hypothetical protein